MIFLIEKFVQFHRHGYTFTINFIFLREPVVVGVPVISIENLGHGFQEFMGRSGIEEEFTQPVHLIETGCKKGKNIIIALCYLP